MLALLSIVISVGLSFEYVLIGATGFLGSHLAWVEVAVATISAWCQYLWWAYVPDKTWARPRVKYQCQESFRASTVAGEIHFQPLSCYGWKWKWSHSGVWLFATPWTVAYQTPPSIRFSRQECWSGLPFPSPGDLPDPGIEPGSPALQADALPSEPPGKPLAMVK